MASKARIPNARHLVGLPRTTMAYDTYDAWQDWTELEFEEEPVVEEKRIFERSLLSLSNKSDSEALGRLREMIKEAHTIDGLMERDAISWNEVRLGKLACKACIDVFGLEHLESLKCMDGLAKELSKQGEFDNAISLQSRILKIRTRNYGSLHPETLFTKNALARIYKDQGNLESADNLVKELVEAWQARDTVLPYQTLEYMRTGEELAITLRLCGYQNLSLATHSDVVQAMTDKFGGDCVLWCRKRYSKLLKQSGYKKLAEKEAQDVVLSREWQDLPTMTKLALMMADSGNFGYAEELQREVLEVETQTRSPSHYSVLAAKEGLAKILKARGDLATAEKLLRECLGDIQEAEMQDSLEKAWRSITESLVDVLEASGKLKDAEDLQEELVEANLRNAGPEHPSTLRSKMILACRARVCGTKRAIQLLREVVTIRNDKLGADHFDTIASKARLVTVLQFAGQHNKALKLHAEVVESRNRTLGPEDPKTIGAAAMDYSKSQEESEKLWRKLVETLTELNGREHAQTLRAQMDWAKSLEFLGNYDAAEAINRQVFNDCARILGSQHHRTLSVKSRLAGTLSKRGNHVDAEQLGREVVADRIGAYGPVHPVTLDSKLFLSFTLVRAQKYKSAAELQRQVVEGRIDLFGPHHPQTMRAQKDLARTLLSCAETCDELEGRVVRTGGSRMTVEEICRAKGWNEMDSSFRAFVLPEKLLQVDASVEENVEKTRINPDLPSSFRIA